MVLHGLAHVPPLRDFFVEPNNYKDSKSALVSEERWLGGRVGAGEARHSKGGKVSLDLPKTDTTAVVWYSGGSEYPPSSHAPFYFAITRAVAAVCISMLPLPLRMLQNPPSPTVMWSTTLSRNGGATAGIFLRATLFRLVVRDAPLAPLAADRPSSTRHDRAIFLSQSKQVGNLSTHFWWQIKTREKTQVHAFGEVVRRIWSPSNFKSAVSPHEFIQTVSYASKKRFRPGAQSEAVDFLSWLLNSLHQVFVCLRRSGSVGEGILLLSYYLNTPRE